MAGAVGRSQGWLLSTGTRFGDKQSGPGSRRRFLGEARGGIHQSQRRVRAGNSTPRTHPATSFQLLNADSLAALFPEAYMETQRQEVEPADIIIPQELLPAQPNGHRVVPGVSVDRAATVATAPSLHTVPSDKPVSLRVSVVIPTLNEVGNIAAVLEQMRRFDDIIIVDGFSQDGTVERARVGATGRPRRRAAAPRQGRRAAGRLRGRDRRRHRDDGRRREHGPRRGRRLRRDAQRRVRPGQGLPARLRWWVPRPDHRAVAGQPRAVPAWPTRCSTRSGPTSATATSPSAARPCRGSRSRRTGSRSSPRSSATPPWPACGSRRSRASSSRGSPATRTSTPARTAPAS